MLVPVFALGAYADEVMADTFPVTEGVTGWVVSNRRTRNVERADQDPIVAVVEGTEMEPESLVSVPLLVEDRVVAALNVYRIGTDKSFSDAEVAQVERFATMAALAFDSARQRDTLREQARTDGLTGLLNHRACHERLRRGDRARRPRSRRPLERRRARPRPLQGRQRRLRPRRGRQGARAPRRRSCARPCARATSWRGSAARSSR